MAVVGRPTVSVVKCAVWVCLTLQIAPKSNIKVKSAYCCLFSVYFSLQSTLLCWATVAYTSFNRWPLCKVGQLIEFYMYVYKYIFICLTVGSHFPAALITADGIFQYTLIR